MFVPGTHAVISTLTHIYHLPLARTQITFLLFGVWLSPSFIEEIRADSDKASIY